MAAACMSQDSENDGQGMSSETRLRVCQQALIDRLFQESGAASWGLSPERFAAALERSAAKSFAAARVDQQKLEPYLGALHLKDLALSTACAEGLAEAWEHFVATYRGYLRASAGAILRCSISSPVACELADSLFADLYGLKEGKLGERSLFRYFHGRSSLKTWLRAVLAQRHVDSVRLSRRFTPWDEDSDEPVGRHRPGDGLPNQTPVDPHRERLVVLFTHALELALASLPPGDKQRLRLYYAEELTLAEIGRRLGEHESSASRNLERTRRELRQEVERSLGTNRVSANGDSLEPALSEAEIALCFAYGAESAPIDFDKLFPATDPSGTPSGRHEP
jgi:RNA polymerase sigma factor (sigma-70 family)